MYAPRVFGNRNNGLLRSVRVRCGVLPMTEWKCSSLVIGDKVTVRGNAGQVAEVIGFDRPTGRVQCRLPSGYVDWYRPGEIGVVFPPPAISADGSLTSPGDGTNGEHHE
jgi:hypothetical protein